MLKSVARKSPIKMVRTDTVQNEEHRVNEKRLVNEIFITKCNEGTKRNGLFATKKSFARRKSA